ncbi:MAG: hypothetical protein QXM75_02545, partial [Candidatus Diapherotrites archaeon]
AISFSWLFLAVIMCVSFLVFYSSPKILSMVTELRRNARNNNAEDLFGPNFAETIAKYKISEAELSNFYNFAIVAVILSAICMLYMFFIYPFLTIKQAAKISYLKALVVYLLNAPIILAMLLAFVIHL